LGSGGLSSGGGGASAQGIQGHEVGARVMILERSLEIGRPDGGGGGGGFYGGWKATWVS